MRKLNKMAGGIVAVAVLAVFAPNAFADTIVITGHTDYRDGSGGEFNITANDAGGAALLAGHLAGYFQANGTTLGTADGTAIGTGFGGQIGFETFCIEHGEFITLPGTYEATYGTGAIAGGPGGNPDPISVGTAFLYYAFATGQLTDAFVGQGAGSGYTYPHGATRAADAEDLQFAIWHLEQEVSLAAAGGIGAGGNVFLNLVIAQFGSLANAMQDNTLYNVGVLNLTSNNGQTLNQSQLILGVPDGGLTLALLGMGLSGLALWRRRAA